MGGSFVKMYGVFFCENTEFLSEEIKLYSGDKGLFCGESLNF